MKLTVLALSISVLAACGCSFVPKVIVPDGSARKPINSEARIADYRARTAEEQVAAADKSALARQVAYLQGEIAKLKTYVVQLSTIASSTEAGPARAAPPSPAVSPPSWRERAEKKASLAAPAGDTESMEAHNGAVVFRLLQPYAKAEFAPSQQFRTDLLSLARESTRVDIRGRTDAIADNAGDRMVARRRALCAQAYLVDNGVPANKIRVSFLAAGDRVASNATPEGRALNRRIEIETLGVNTSNLRGGSSDVMGSL